MVGRKHICKGKKLWFFLRGESDWLQAAPVVKHAYIQRAVVCFVYMQRGIVRFGSSVTLRKPRPLRWAQDFD